MLGVPYNIYFIISLILVIMASIVEGFVKGCFTGVLGFSWRDARVFFEFVGFMSPSTAPGRVL